MNGKKLLRVTSILYLVHACGFISIFSYSIIKGLINITNFTLIEIIPLVVCILLGSLGLIFYKKQSSSFFFIISGVTLTVMLPSLGLILYMDYLTVFVFYGHIFPCLFILGGILKHRALKLQKPEKEVIDIVWH